MPKPPFLDAKNTVSQLILWGLSKLPLLQKMPLKPLDLVSHTSGDFRNRELISKVRERGFDKSDSTTQREIILLPRGHLFWTFYLRVPKAADTEDYHSKEGPNSRWAVLPFAAKNRSKSHPLLFGNPNPGKRGFKLSVWRLIQNKKSYDYVIHTRLSRSKVENSVIGILQMTHQKGFWTQGETEKKIFPYALEIRRLKTSSTMLNKKAERESSCLWPFEAEKKVDGEPLIRTGNS